MYVSDCYIVCTSLPSSLQFIVAISSYANGPIGVHAEWLPDPCKSGNGPVYAPMNVHACVVTLYSYVAMYSSTVCMYAIECM